MKYYCSSSRKCTLFSLYRFLCIRKRDVEFAEIHFRHLGMDWNRTRPVTSDMSNCDQATFAFREITVLKKISILLSKFRVFCTLKEQLFAYWVALKSSSKRPKYAICVCVCDCSQQTELRQRNTPHLLYRMVRQEHSPIKQLSL